MAKRTRKRTTSSRKIVARDINKSTRTLNRSSNPSGLAIAAFLFSLLGFIFCWMLEWGWALSLIAIIFAAASYKKHRSKGLAIISLMIGLLGIVIWLLLLFFSRFSI